MSHPTTQHVEALDGILPSAEAARSLVVRVPIDLPIENLPARVAQSDEQVVEFEAAWKSHGQFPPVEGTYDATLKKLYLEDGWHRWLAAQRAGLTHILIRIRRGNYRDAMLRGIAANQKHGLKLTPKDRRHQVGLVLLDEECARWSSNMIARLVGVSPQLVESVREQLAQERQAAGVAVPPAARQYRRGNQTVSYPSPNAKKKAAPLDPAGRVVKSVLAKAKGWTAAQRRTLAERLVEALEAPPAGGTDGT